jgi:hypothetical protein
MVLGLSHFFGLNGLVSAQMAADMLTFVAALPIGLGVLKHLKNGTIQA